MQTPAGVRSSHPSALRPARYFNTDARSWMNLQNRYEPEIAARDEAAALRAVRPREAA